MADLARQPHPFVNGSKLGSMNGHPVALVGRVEKISSGSFYVKTTDDKEILISDFDGSEELTQGASVEVRGIVQDDGLKFTDLTIYDGDFDNQVYEQMLEYYHGMCSKMTISA